MCSRLRDEPRQLSQSYGFIARNASEEDKKSAAFEAVGAAAAAATAKAAGAAPAAAACCCKLEQTSLQPTVFIEVFAPSLEG